MQGLSIERLNNLAELLVDPQLDDWLPEERWESVLASDDGLEQHEIDQVCDFVRTCIRVNPDLKFELTTYDADDIPPGSLIDRYTIVERVGAGGMGTVYKAQFRGMDMEPRTVALKIGHGHAKFVRRLRAERNILSRLDHPNIIKILDAGTTAAGLPYFAAEFVEGGVKPSKFCEGKPLNERIHLFIKLCGVVEAIHEQNIVHRDLKPGNILVSRTAEPKLLDFGLAAFIEPLSNAPSFVKSTNTSKGLGTDGRMSPQQESGGAPSRGDDIFALGTILRDFLALPTDREEARTKLRCDQVARRCLENDPGRRFANATELATALNGAFGKPTTLFVRLIRPVRTLRTGVALIVLALAGTASWIWFAESANRDAQAAKRRETERDNTRREQAWIDVKLDLLSRPLGRATGLSAASFEEQEHRALEMSSDGDQAAKALLARFYIACRTQTLAEYKQFGQKPVNPFDETTYWTDDAIADRATTRILIKQCSEEKVSMAYRWWKEIADGGDAKASTHLAWLWIKGAGGITSDPSKALVSAHQAAAAKDKGGLYVLGLIHLQGFGVVKDEEKAFDLFEDAAWRGSIEGELAMIEMYLLGRSQKRLKDPTKAYAWALVASATKVGEEAGEDDPFLQLKRAKANSVKHRDELEAVLAPATRTIAAEMARSIQRRIASSISEGH